MTQNHTTLGPHPELSGLVALDLHDVQNDDLREALDLACENGYWAVDRDETEFGAIVYLARLD